jgi:hypothetical protein
MLNTYPLTLPKISDSLTSELLEVALTYNFEQDGVPNPIIFNGVQQVDREISKNYHKVTNQSQAIYKIFSIPEELSTAVKKEMLGTVFPFDNTHLYYQRIEGGETISPHRDAVRKSHILYNISNDGATTNFHDKLIDDETRFAFDFHEITAPIETYKFDPFQWYLFNSQKIHSVTNITNTRVAVCVDMQYEYAKLYNYFKDKLIFD